MGRCTHIKLKKTLILPKDNDFSSSQDPALGPVASFWKRMAARLKEMASVQSNEVHRCRWDKLVSWRQHEHIPADEHDDNAGMVAQAWETDPHGIAGKSIEELQVIYQLADKQSAHECRAAACNRKWDHFVADMLNTNTKRLHNIMKNDRCSAG
jgi:hypothetical protein